MGKFRTEELKNLSLSRILGFSCQRIWMFLMFYSIIPYAFSSNIRSTLYHHQTISLFAFVLSCVLFIAFHKPHTRIRKAELLIWGSGALMALGCILCFASDSQTPTGMLIATIAGGATGIGSGVTFILWMRLFYSKGPITTLVEYSLASIIGLTASLILLFIPHVITLSLLVLSPFGSAFGLSKNSLIKKGFRAPHAQNLPLSKNAQHLFIRALTGTLLIGFLQGLTDITSGFTAFSTTNEHGVYLFCVGILVLLAIAFMGLIKADPLDDLYRGSMLFLCFGFVLMSFMKERYTFFSSISFGGYLIFIAFLLLVSGRISSAFGTGIIRPAAASIGSLYLGEALGLVAGSALTSMFGESLNASYISAVCVLIFLIVHLFLFNETDLIHAGIGDIDVVEDAQGGATFKIAAGNDVLGADGAGGDADGLDGAMSTGDAGAGGAGAGMGGAGAERAEVTGACAGGAAEAVGAKDKIAGVGASEATESAKEGSAAGIQTGSATGIQATKTSAQSSETTPSESNIFKERSRALTQKYCFSPREEEVLYLLLQGRTMARIQEELFISAGTVSTHMRHIYQKAGVANKQQLLDLAFPKKTSTLNQSPD